MCICVGALGSQMSVSVLQELEFVTGGCELLGVDMGTKLGPSKEKQALSVESLLQPLGVSFKTLSTNKPHRFNE